MRVAQENHLLELLNAAAEIERIGNTFADHLSIKAHTDGLTRVEKEMLDAWDAPAFKLHRELEKARAHVGHLPGQPS